MGSSERDLAADDPGTDPGGEEPPHRGIGHIHPDGEPPEHAAEQERLELLREAAIQAEYATGRQEDTEEEARRNVLLRLGTIFVGFIVLIAGLVMMALPGPGVVTVLAGLAILSRELAWAERMMEYVQRKAKIDELKQQPKWIQWATWGATAAAVTASLVYFLVIR